MPPKKQKTAIEKIRKTIADKKKKEEEKIEAEKESEYIYEIDSDTIKRMGNPTIKEEKSRQKFFSSIDTVETDEKLQRMITRFISDPKGRGRGAFFSVFNFIPTLSMKKQFAQSYLDQDEYSSVGFIKMYFADDAVKNKIAKYAKKKDREWKKRQEEEAKEKEAEDLMKQMMHDEEEDEEEEKIKKKMKRKKSVPKPPPKRKTIILDIDEQEVIESTAKPKSKIPGYKPKFKEGNFIVNENCYYMYERYPWVSETVKKVWLYPVNELANEYIIKSDDALHTKVVDGETWHHASKKFFILNCGKYSRKRSQKDDVLTLYTYQNKPVEVRVGLETNKGKFIIQDENIFEAEKEYIDYVTRGPVNRIKRLGDASIDSSDTTVRQLLMTSLSDALKSAVPDIADYGRNSEYINEAIDLIIDESSTLHEALEKIGSIYVYSHINSSNNVFRKRLIEGYYTPVVLVKLDDSDKFPTIYSDPKISLSRKESFKRLVDNNIDNYVTSTLASLYSMKNPADKNKLKTDFSFAMRINTPSIKTACVNGDEVNDMMDIFDETVDEYLYYTEDDKNYCLYIPDLINKFKLGDYTNKYTGNQLSDEFIEKFKFIYMKKPSLRRLAPQSPQKDIEKKEELEEGEVDKRGVAFIELDPPLYVFMSEAVDKLERTLAGQDELDAKFWKDYEKRKQDPARKSIKVDESDEEEEEEFEDTDTDDEEEEEEEEEEYGEDDTEEEEYGDEDEDPSSAAAGRVSDSDDSDNDIDESVRCATCDRKIDRKSSLKSKIFKNKKHKNIHFDCFDCFEKYDWPKYHKKS